MTTAIVVGAGPDGLAAAVTHGGLGHAQRRGGRLQRQLRRHRHDRDGQLPGQCVQRDDQGFEYLFGREVARLGQVGDDLEVQDLMRHNGFDERGDSRCGSAGHARARCTPVG